MAKYKLAISIPTYNRAENIDLLLQEIIKTTEELNIGVYIFDGSSDNKTKKVCEKYIQFSCLNYIRQSEDIKERHWKSVTIPDCEYLLVSRDRSIIKPDFYKIILRLLEENLDIYILTDVTNKIEKKMNFIKSPKDLFKEYLLSMTLFGSYIFKKDILKYTDENIEAKYYKSFALLAKVFHSIVYKNDFKSIYIPFYFKKNYYIIPNTSNLSPEQLFDIWGDDWIKMIDDLPQYYDELKEKAKHVRDIDYWKFYKLLDLRKNGSIDLKTVLKYRKIIKQISSKPIIIFVFVGLMPKILVKPFVKIVKPITNLLTIIIDKIIREIKNIAF